MQWEAPSAAVLRSHAVVIAPQELITQQRSRLVTPCTLHALHCVCLPHKPRQSVASLLPLSRTAFTCQYFGRRTQNNITTLCRLAFNPIEGRFSDFFYSELRITSFQNIYSNHKMSYYDIDAILTDAEVRAAQSWLLDVIVDIGHIYIAAANPDSPSRKSPASSTSRSPT